MWQVRMMQELHRHELDLLCMFSEEGVLYVRLD